MILYLFFLFTNAQTNKYLIKDLFDVRQGKLVLNNDGKIKKTEAKSDKSSKESNSIEVLTLNSINWEFSNIKSEHLLTISQPKSMPESLNNYDYIINRVGQTKGCSLLESNFDFENHKVIPSHHFLVCSPRKIIQQNQLPFFHALLEIHLNDLIAKKEKQDNSESSSNKKQKSNYVTVKEIENIEVEIPTENFDMIVGQFDMYYKIYASSYKNFMMSKENLNNHKLELSNFKKQKNAINK